ALRPYKVEARETTRRLSGQSACWCTRYLSAPSRHRHQISDHLIANCNCSLAVLCIVRLVQGAHSISPWSFPLDNSEHKFKFPNQFLVAFFICTNRSVY